MVIVLIFFIAIVVFVIMLIAAIAIVRSEGRLKNEGEPKEDHKSGSPAAESDRPSPQDGPKDERNSRSLSTRFSILFRRDRLINPLKSIQRTIVDRSRKESKTLNWIVCFIIATYVAGLDYSRVSYVVSNISLQIYFILLAIISPTCLAIVWLRLTGMEWRGALRLFIWVPVTFGAIWLILPYLGFVLKYLSGQCC